jgi:hypothetical protein
MPSLLLNRAIPGFTHGLRPCVIAKPFGFAMPSKAEAFAGCKDV